ncbi:hypothetical protein LXL04_028029 [Taraxacum kok-saghyz]
MDMNMNLDQIGRINLVGRGGSSCTCRKTDSSALAELAGNATQSPELVEIAGVPHRSTLCLARAHHTGARSNRRKKTEGMRGGYGCRGQLLVPSLSSLQQRGFRTSRRSLDTPDEACLA